MDTQQRRRIYMARPGQPSGLSRDRIDLRADPAWVARVERQAERLGITVTAYVKQATSRALEADEATDPGLQAPPTP
jgi:hypothetical protein